MAGGVVPASQRSTNSKGEQKEVDIFFFGNYCYQIFYDATKPANDHNSPANNDRDKDRRKSHSAANKDRDTDRVAAPMQFFGSEFFGDQFIWEESLTTKGDEIQG